MPPKFLRITVPARSTVVCEHAIRADTFLTRLVGLLGKSSLQPGGGLLIDPSSGVHTWGMSFPIDVVALDGTLRVVRLSPHTGPWRIAGLGLKTRSVLELPAGQIERSLLSVGDELSVVPSTSVSSTSAEGSANVPLKETESI